MQVNEIEITGWTINEVAHDLPTLYQVIANENGRVFARTGEFE